MPYPDAERCLSELVNRVQTLDREVGSLREQHLKIVHAQGDLARENRMQSEMLKQVREDTRVIVEFTHAVNWAKKLGSTVGWFLTVCATIAGLIAAYRGWRT